MASQPESDQFDAGVYQLEKTDPVLGGVGGIVNNPFINLTNRTRYLYNRIQEILGIAKVYVAAGGTANAITAAYTPAIAALVDGQIVRIKSGFANTGAVTFTPNATGAPPIAPSPVYGRDHQPLTGGEFAVNGQNSLAWNASLNAGAGAWVLVENTGGAQRGVAGVSQAHLATVAQIQSAGYAADTGAANAYVVTLAPAVAAYFDGMKVRFLVSHTSTGACTLAVNGLAATAIVGGAHAALVSGELFAGGYAEAEYNAGLAKFVLLECTGAPLQISPGTQPQHAVQLSQVRQRLTANLTIYVATTGSDTLNTGLSVGSPFLTIQKASDVLQNMYDLNGFVATIQIANGTYPSGGIVSGPYVGAKGTGSVLFQGNMATPTSVVISIQSGTVPLCFNASSGASYTIQGMTLISQVAGGTAINAAGSSVAFNNVQFGLCTSAHIVAFNGAQIGANGPYTIANGTVNHASVTLGGNISIGVAISVPSGTPGFSGSFVTASAAGSIIANGMTFTGSVTGTRYNANSNGVIVTNGGGASFFPGSVAGTTATGGQYV